MFCTETGAYLLAPEKQVKEVFGVSYAPVAGTEFTLVFVYLDDTNGFGPNSLQMAHLERVVHESGDRLVVETKNSVYAGRNLKTK